ncbi:hypothetical protein T265_12073 [Opisthorchis viverrini]|uniref:Uncharacterized protein n=1 Tax=Opisthorchis viverrini TaxID=6198 RepID=A0A074YW25_OPIVI|nr:hypothetical protein T265_12073 [Opisthorchis viverrini]KER18976.1 hypothetical protein T265_12073 [Opisthorchis viverrini]
MPPVGKELEIKIVQSYGDVQLFEESPECKEGRFDVSPTKIYEALKTNTQSNSLDSTKVIIFTLQPHFEASLARKGYIDPIQEGDLYPQRPGLSRPFL